MITPTCGNCGERYALGREDNHGIGVCSWRPEPPALPLVRPQSPRPRAPTSPPDCAFRELADLARRLAESHRHLCHVLVVLNDTWALSEEARAAGLLDEQQKLER